MCRKHHPRGEAGLKKWVTTWLAAPFQNSGVQELKVELFLTKILQENVCFSLLKPMWVKVQVELKEN